MFRSFGFDEFLLLLDGLRWTLALTALAFAGGGALGLALLVMRIAKLRALRWLATGWIQAVQGTPLLGHLFVIFFGLPLVGFDVSRWVAATVALSVYGSAFLAEIWRGAVDAIPRGQWEAAAALGFNWVERHAYVILPQALRRLLPPFVSLLVNIIQNTTLAGVIGGLELLSAAQRQNERVAAVPPIGLGQIHAFEIFAGVAALFFVISFPLTRLAAYLEKRLV